MKKIIVTAFCALMSLMFSCQVSLAQENKDAKETKDKIQNLSSDRNVSSDRYEVVDSVIYIPAANLNSELVGKSIFSVLPEKTFSSKAWVSVHQSEEIRNAMMEYAERNKENMDMPIRGFRVRIFFDNRQTARAESEKIVDAFRASHVGVNVYRSYEAPYFSVTVGDCRTRSEALVLLSKVKNEYPSAYVVRHGIAFPSLDRDKAYVADTLKLYRHFTR